MVKIAASILSADFSRLGQEIEMLDRIGADSIHIDVMDGHFVPNITFGPMVVSSIRKNTRLPFDIHLMMNNPMDFVDSYIEAGADSITIHAEVLPHLHGAIQYIKKRGVKCAVSLNPSTSLSILDYILEDLDMVLIMTVNPGLGGQEFIPSMIRKISQLREKLVAYGKDLDIQVDGGICLNNINRVVKAGANVIVTGSFLFNSINPSDTVKALRKEADQ